MFLVSLILVPTVWYRPFSPFYSPFTSLKTIILMKQLLTITLLLAATSLQAQKATPVQVPGYPISPVPFTSVKVGEGFWGQRLQASREVTIPLAFSKCEESGRYKNFEIAARQMAGENTENVKVEGFSFDDTDVYKTIDGASYSLQTYPDKKLVAYIDSVLEIVKGGQEPDGYLNTAWTMNPKHPHNWHGTKRWEKVEELSHEFYNLGHMLEGAVAHFQATGKRNFLDIAIRYADCVCREIGLGEGQVDRVPGHQIAEMGLVKLYLVTGDKKYLDQAKYFLDRRGKTTRKDAYSQAHKPVVEQDEAVGHAVRATYMYAGMADVAAITGDDAYLHAIDKIWDNIVSKKYYITGGIGARHAGEAFGDNYELPNAEAYCETCAAIGNVYVNHRLFLLHGESKYYDVVERTLYNALISGVSLEGNSFFYPNPLAVASDMNYARKAWFGCACCPSNISRFIPSLPGYVYAVKDRSVYVNLFMNNTATLNVAGRKVELSQQTGYPYADEVCIKMGKNAAKQFALKVRIPGWVKGDVVPSDLYRFVDKQETTYKVTITDVKGRSVEASAELTEDGYYTIDRVWKKGDVVKVHFDMVPRLVAANDKVVDDRGMVAVERGPLVYCAEWPDNAADVRTYLLNPRAKFTVADTELKTSEGNAYPICTLTTPDAQTLSYASDGRLVVKDAKLTLIPYYAWDHRGQKGGMEVWLPVTVGAASATPRLFKEQGDNGFFNR